MRCPDRRRHIRLGFSLSLCLPVSVSLSLPIRVFSVDFVSLCFSVVSSGIVGADPWGTIRLFSLNQSSESAPPILQQLQVHGPSLAAVVDAPLTAAAAAATVSVSTAVAAAAQQQQQQQLLLLLLLLQRPQ